MQFTSRFMWLQANAASVLLASVIPLVLAIGIAADTMDAADVETLLQRAADASVKGGESANLSDDASIKVLVKTNLSELGALDDLKAISKIEYGDTKDGRFFVRIQGVVDTRFMILVGISRMNVMAYSEMRKVGN